jgi:hypothetical protein
MALMLRATGPGGCCDCAQQVDPCGCSGCDMQCRGVAGLAELCGFSEFTSPSVPPKKYRQMDDGGTHTELSYTIAGCSTGSPGTASTTYGGQALYDRLTCAFTSSLNANGNPISPPTAIGASECAYSRTGSSTARQVTGTGDCCTRLPSGYRTASGTRTTTLSREDTEEDAIERISGAKDTWPIVTCKDYPSWRSTRGPGQFSFGYGAAQVRARVGTKPNTAYTVTIHLAERPIGVGGDYIEFGRQLQANVLTDEDPATENWSDWLDVPHEDGLQIIASRCEVVEGAT